MYIYIYIYIYTCVCIYIYIYIHQVSQREKSRAEQSRTEQNNFGSSYSEPAGVSSLGEQLLASSAYPRDSILSFSLEIHSCRSPYSGGADVVP